jgi:SAM-dependent methyltransferase
MGNAVAQDFRRRHAEQYSEFMPVDPSRNKDASEPSPGRVQWGDLRRLEPISPQWGYDRGHPIDRYYVDDFLARRKSDIRGHVLEVGDSTYTDRFRCDVVKSDVLDIKEDNPKATIRAELTDAPQIASGSFDCILLIQTLHMIYDCRAALATAHRILRSGGVLLATVPGITRIETDGQKGNCWYWSFTSISLAQLLHETFTQANVEIQARGNVLAAIAFLHGIAVEELTFPELDYRDPNYELNIAVGAIKA